MRTGAACGERDEDERRGAADNKARHGTDPSWPLASRNLIGSKRMAVYPESRKISVYGGVDFRSLS
jgi:hypothetical protein